MEKAIRRAIEGGYDWREDEWLRSTCNNSPKLLELRPHRAEAYVLLDPLFWQALSKAEGWTCCGKPDEVEGVKNKGCEYCRVPWNEYMHRFIDYLIEGKDIDEFFNSLLNSHE